jgi:hypothetical protein
LKAAAKSNVLPRGRCQVSRDVIGHRSHIDFIPGTMRSSLLIDLSQGKRIEVEALQDISSRCGRRGGGSYYVDAVCAAEAVCCGPTPTRLSTAR